MARSIDDLYRDIAQHLDACARQFHSEEFWRDYWRNHLYGDLIDIGEVCFGVRSNVTYGPYPYDGAPYNQWRNIGASIIDEIFRRVPASDLPDDPEDREQYLYDATFHFASELARLPPTIRAPPDGVIPIVRRVYI